MKFWSNSEIPPYGPFVPEKRLLAAVLQRAITDFLSGDGELAEGAKAWLLEEESSDAPLTFSFICEALDLDKPGLTKAILRQCQQDRSQAGQLHDGQLQHAGQSHNQGDQYLQQAAV